MGLTMSNFGEKLNSRRFLVTVELNPPKGTEIQPVLNMGQNLKWVVDAFNITDSQSSIMTTGPLALAHLLLDRGAEPIVQFTGRDRNRIALQADLLSSSVLGIENIVCMTGDPPASGDHAEAKGVFELDGVKLIKLASDLMAGSDMSGNPLKGAPQFCIGATVNPGAKNLDREIVRMGQKAEAGARFFQTQAVFHPDSFAEFMSRTNHIKAPVLAGIILLKSPRMARFLNENLPGVYVPRDLVEQIEQSDDRAKTGIEIAARLINEMRGMCRGVHIMAIGWERYLPQLFEEAGLAAAR